MLGVGVESVGDRRSGEDAIADDEGAGEVILGGEDVEISLSF